MTPLETWLEYQHKTSKDLFIRYQTEMDTAVAIIEKLKKALEEFDCIHFTDSGQSCAWGSDKAYRALAIDPDSLLRNSNNGEK